MEKIGILGAGGQSDEAESYLIDRQVEFHAVSKEYIVDNSQIDILNPEDYQKILPVIAAIGAPAVRRKIVEAWEGDNFTTIISELSYIDKSTKVGVGTIVAPRAVITTNVEIGRHTIVNVASSISHNCKLGEYVTIGPGAHIGGNVELGDGVFIGIGAIISNNIKIAEGCVVGAGAVVMEDIIEPNSVVVGIPAKTIKINEGWLSEV